MIDIRMKPGAHGTVFNQPLIGCITWARNRTVKYIKQWVLAIAALVVSLEACVSSNSQCKCPDSGFTKTTAIEGTMCYKRVAQAVNYNIAKDGCTELNPNATLPLVNSAEDLVAWSDLTSRR